MNPYISFLFLEYYQKVEKKFKKKKYPLETKLSNLSSYLFILIFFNFFWRKSLRFALILRNLTIENDPAIRQWELTNIFVATFPRIFPFVCTWQHSMQRKEHTAYREYCTIFLHAEAEWKFRWYLASSSRQTVFRA